MFSGLHLIRTAYAVADKDLCGGRKAPSRNSVLDEALVALSRHCHNEFHV